MAGILFALLYGSSLALVLFSIPADPVVTTVLTPRDLRLIDIAMNLMPYAGIAFLWFIGVIRDRLGDFEDRFFATVLLGSGVLFLATTFVGAALGGGLVASYVRPSGSIIAQEVFEFGRGVMFRVISIYSIRMAGVFMISLGTIWLHTGLMPRVWTFLTYALALVLLVTISLSLWVTLVFPAWVLGVSVYLLIRPPGTWDTAAADERGAT